MCKAMHGLHALVKHFCAGDVSACLTLCGAPALCRAAVAVGSGAAAVPRDHRGAQLRGRAEHAAVGALRDARLVWQVCKSIL